MTRAAKAAATMTKPAAIRKRYSPRMVMDADDAHCQRPPHGDKVGTHCQKAPGALPHPGSSAVQPRGHLGGTIR